MLLRHKIDGTVFERFVEPPSFILTNNKGGFANIGCKVASKYNGVFFNINQKLYKVIEEISSPEPIFEVSNRLKWFERKRKTFMESYYMPTGRNTLIYETDKTTKLKITLDIREPYDMREWERHYEVAREKECITVRYTKKNENTNEEEFTGYLVIYGKFDSCKIIKEWTSQQYKDDEKRHDPPYIRHIYCCAEIETSKMSLSFGLDPKKVLAEAKESYMKDQKPDLHKKAETKQDIAKSCCENSLELLSTETGILAGLPWFFQQWSRDEIISLSEAEKQLGKNMVNRHLDSVGEDGRIQSILPQSDLASADSAGWLFHRAYRILDKLGKREREKLIGKMHHLLYAVTKNRLQDEMIYSYGKESWMDTAIEGDDRQGYCIEMQAMLLYMYKRMHELSGNEQYREKESLLVSKIREKFWDGNILADRLGDWTARPNIFIAAYFYPELLRKEEWTKCFQNVMAKLWLPWGGFTTIDKSSRLFCQEYTGADNRSYHRGDSWYYLNNLAGIVLLRTDKEAFKEQINKIFEASTNEILWMGAAGHHAELSSAKMQRSEGCTCQAWSAALYLELCNELKNN